MEEKPVIKNCITFGFTVDDWYYDGEGKLCHTSSAPKTVEGAMALCKEVTKGTARTYNGFRIVKCEFRGQTFFAPTKKSKQDVTDF